MFATPALRLAGAIDISLKANISGRDLYFLENSGSVWFTAVTGDFCKLNKP